MNMTLNMVFLKKNVSRETFFFFYSYTQDFVFEIYIKKYMLEILKNVSRETSLNG